MKKNQNAQLMSNFDLKINTEWGIKSSHILNEYRKEHNDLEKSGYISEKWLSVTLSVFVTIY